MKKDSFKEMLWPPAIPSFKLCMCLSVSILTTTSTLLSLSLPFLTHGFLPLTHTPTSSYTICLYILLSFMHLCGVLPSYMLQIPWNLFDLHFTNNLKVFLTQNFCWKTQSFVLIMHPWDKLNNL